MPKAIPSSQLAMFQCLLIGTWANDDELRDKGGLPLSFNVMPLPQTEPPPLRPVIPGTKYGGFILKNFAFCETIRFNGSIVTTDPPQHQDPAALAVVASAPNRGGSYTQSSHAVFYDQQVKFAEGPDANKVVHVENGAWLHFGSEKQQIEPYGTQTLTDGQVLKQPPYITIAKQISVPHGNSVLALGNVDLNDGDKFDASLDGLEANTILSGAPTIPDAFVPYPVPADIATPPSEDVFATTLGTPVGFENPNPKWTLNPNRPLQLALEILQPKSHIHWRVTTLPLLGGKGVVTNVPFENQKSRVVDYWADYWLLSKEQFTKGRMPTFDYLAYTQTILMDMMILGKDVNGAKEFKKYRFPHVTSNTVKRLPGTPAEARHASEKGTPACNAPKK
jgi:hypothetical protein